MKKLFIIVCSLFLFSNSYSQAIFIANNNPGADVAPANIYATLQGAIDGAAPGDIVHVVPSSVNYGDAVVDKALTIFGIGFRPDKDLALRSEVNRLDINASDIRVSGIVSDDTWYLGWLLSGVTLSNLTFENNRVGRLRMSSTNGVDINNMIVRNNLITASGGTFDSKNFEFYTTSNVTVTNNLIITTCCSNSGTRATGVTFSYNIFRYNGTTGNTGNTFTSVNACLFEYNIFFGSTPNVPGGSNNNTFNYNLAFGSADNIFNQIGDPNGNTGIGNVSDMDPLFTNLPLGSTWSDGYDLSLQGGSPADNIDGSGGIAGVTGGATPWDPEGTLLPTIQSVTLPSVVNQGTDLQVQIRAKGN